MKRMHLLCNAHLDPVWLWRWEEGAAEALSTFRIAAEFCEKYDMFIFNHNEAVLYQWIEEYDIELFRKIQSLVSHGKWHIMGGWYLQPDCNMPSGEAMVRQIIEGRKYFFDKFGEYPSTAINFDSFGHSRGLVQIMKKSGYDSYVFGRPFEKDCSIPDEDFIWVGLDGSKVVANRAYDHYLTLKGEATKKIEKWIEESDDDSLGLVLWGIGNHGGGPSDIDLKNVTELINTSEHEIIHSTPENYFKELLSLNKNLSEFDKSLNAWAVGCYTSQIRIKQKYRELENEYFLVEKMATTAYLNGIVDYPAKELYEARKDMIFCQFHDILPGSSIKGAEDDSIRNMEHGLEILSRLKNKLFILMSKNQEPGDEDNLPIFVYNPHPYKVENIVECEFQLANQNWGEDITIPIVYKDDEVIPSQLVKEASNLNLDWRKNIVFKAELEPLSVNRFYCNFKRVEKPKPNTISNLNSIYTFTNDSISVSINRLTGLMEKITVNNIEYVNKSIKFNIIDDNEDPWGSKVDRFDNIIGEFKLMNSHNGSLFSGIKNEIDSFRIIEDGDIRTVIECVYEYNNSHMVAHYKLSKVGTEIGIDIKVYWNEKDKMLKLSVPTNMSDCDYRGQIMFGNESLKSQGQEVVGQKWTGAFSYSDNKAITIINKGNYGSDYSRDAINVTVLRSPAYSALPIKDRSMIKEDRFSDRIDQGERSFAFWLNFGDIDNRLNNVDREATEHNEEPYALSFYPMGGEKREYAYLQLSNNIQLSAFKKAENSDNLIIRLFNPMHTDNETLLKIVNYSKKDFSVKFTPFEVKTFIYDIHNDEIVETDLMEGLSETYKKN